jgi:hypothetical protein
MEEQYGKSSIIKLIRCGSTKWYLRAHKRLAIMIREIGNVRYPVKLRSQFSCQVDATSQLCKLWRVNKKASITCASW